MLQFAALTLLVLMNGPSDDSESENLSYEVAYRRAQEERKPLVVLVGADWCSACKSMKSETIATLRRAGDFREVVYTQVDKDMHPEIAEQVMQGKTLPQIVVFCESDAGWRRFSLTGMQSDRRVRELLRRAVDVLPRRRQ